MENAHTTPLATLPISGYPRTLADIEAKIMYYNNIVKWHLDDSEEDKPPEAIDAHNRLGELYRLYFDTKQRVDRQVLYNTEMKRRIVLKVDKRKSEDWGDYLLITINPDPSKLTTEKQIRSFVSACRSFFRSAVFHVAEFVFEQRGKQEGDYPGVHCHGIVHRKEVPSKVKGEIARRFVRTGIVGNPLHVNVLNINPKELGDALNYLKGPKKGKNATEEKDKREKQANDVFFRRDFGLDAFEVSGEGKLLVP